MKDTYELINHLIEADVDYIHALLVSALTSKPVDSEDEKTYLELIIEHVNGRMPLMAAGSIVILDDTALALENGVSLLTIGHALIMNPAGIEKAQSGNEARIERQLRSRK
ncbi:hypothetical protein [Bacillus cereus]|uniref:Uncharacterized protein n=1 Tax=Bacillus cereus (strain VD146) TaxID=1053236 RepID=R8NAS1_BACCX|nr:hypothetical protein [Bacillus cereus]EOP43178.1 hypothetical protein IK1_00228 [Bacillus cereus VD146]